ncbi:hypothetical protein KJ819_02655 [Patescibacteria group bacterium]|nr:hypothetical protein [Patescibacteria group bacterium]MBU1500818.1 hypothetical protein [Patescibacteria group bacterium]MBU2080873.1 hypothetical protein [Patescibacteria group bacterium]MBU2123978.1 hypothetical protein [Patescibacteria group bacterium]MBU2194731.1 hypothetical protein [Patescibacteria group bacterium]
MKDIWPGVYIGLVVAVVQIAVPATLWFLVDPLNQFSWHWFNAVPFIVACIFFVAAGIITTLFAHFHELDDEEHGFF